MADYTDEANPASPNRTRDAERSKQAILDAAEQLFAQSSFEATSLQQIGEHANVSRGTPTYFFKSKAQLYQAVLERLLQAEHDAVIQSYAHATAEIENSGSAIREAVSQHIDFLVHRPAFLHILTREALAGGKRLQHAHNYLAVFQAGQDILAQEQEQGILRPIDTRYLLLSILALCWTPFVYGNALLPGLNLDTIDPNFIRQYKEHILDLILYGILNR